MNEFKEALEGNDNNLISDKIYDIEDLADEAN